MKALTIGIAALGICWTFGSAVVQAQALSNRPIRIVVPFTPGTGMDLLARAIGPKMTDRWGQAVVVDNKPGASGNIGTEIVAKSPPDGHTLLMTANTFVMTPSLIPGSPDPVTAFAPIALLATTDIILAVHRSVGTKTAADFIAKAKAAPESMAYASPGNGTPQHLAMELLKLRSGAAITHVPYRGSAGAITDLVNGQIAAMFIPVHTALAQAQGGQLELLAIGSKSRPSNAPQIPTFAEAGIRDVEVDFWYGLLAPVGTPEDIVRRLNKEVRDIIALPDVAESLSKQGLTTRGSSPEDFARLIAMDFERWAKVVAAAKIKAD